MHHRLGLAMAVAAVLVTAAARPAGAGPAVTLNMGAVDLDEPAVPGGRYTLPTVAVINPGDASANYSVEPIAVTGTPEGAAEWFQLAPPTFHLDAGASHDVRVRLRPPVDAPPGDYEVLLTAKITDLGGSTANGATAGLGAAVAARVSFTVAPASTLAGWWNTIAGWLDASSPWPQGTAAIAALTFAGRAFARRFEVRLTRRPAGGSATSPLPVTDHAPFDQTTGPLNTR